MSKKKKRNVPDEKRKDSDEQETDAAPPKKSNAENKQKPREKPEDGKGNIDPATGLPRLRW